MSFLLGWLVTAFNWLINELYSLGVTLYNDVLTGLLAVVNAIPVPSFFSEVAGWVGSIPPTMAFFIQGFEIPQGIGILLAAMTLRFIIRRIFDVIP